MAIDGIEGRSNDYTRVENKEIVKEKKEIPPEGDSRVKDPGKFNTLFDNTSNEPKGLRQEGGNDVFELNSRPPESSGRIAQTQISGGRSEIEATRERDSAGNRENQDPLAIQTPINPALETRTPNTAGAAANPTSSENPAQASVFEQEAVRNDVRSREERFQQQLENATETNQESRKAENEVAAERVEQRASVFTDEAVEQRVNLADEVRRQRVEAGETREREEVNNPDNLSNDVTRNLDLLA